MNLSINSIDDLLMIFERLSNGENVKVTEVGTIQHTIKLQGGRFEDYNIGYIDAEIARVIASYQDSFYRVADILKKDFGIDGIDKNQLIRFSLEKGSLEIKTDELLTNLLGVIKDMESQDQLILLTIIALIIGGCWAFGKFLTHNEKIEEIKSRNEGGRIIAEIAKNKELQNACNAPKTTLVKILKDDEKASFSLGNDVITNQNKEDYNFKEIEDTTQTKDIEGDFKILGFEKTNNNKKFKIILDGKTCWADADIIDVNAKMKLAKASIQEQEAKLKLRIVKEYNKIKEIVILNVE
ncbi:hypothetical protein [Campylobacter lari]|uniref:hypothetical protein n=1 Tax=Campylobacter lari TaxID=201 RepID=UPI0021F6FF9B|nr:hypothetical protein [Campylobacter lari]MCW0188385.1 hypothetical protein [Campylobacter lari]HEF1154066.1 hypothetical protein [Campylobacter lari]